MDKKVGEILMKVHERIRKQREMYTMRSDIATPDCSNEACKKINVLYEANKNVENVWRENNELSSRAQDTAVEIEAIQITATELRRQLEAANLKIVRLTNAINQLLERLLTDVKILETQLQTGDSAGLATARVELMERIQAKKLADLTSQLASCHDEIDQLRNENRNLKKQNEKRRQYVFGSSLGGVKNKRSRYTESESLLDIEESLRSENMSKQNKQPRLVEQISQRGFGFDTVKMESFGHDECEDNDAPKQLSCTATASSGLSANLHEIKLQPNDRYDFSSGYGNSWRQVQQERQQPNFVIRQAYEEKGADSICNEGFSHPHASRFTFDEPRESTVNRVGVAIPGGKIEIMNNAGMDFDLLNESDNGEQSGSMIADVPVHDSDHQQMDLTNENKEIDQKEPNDRSIFDDTASDNNVSLEVEVEYKEVETDGVLSEGEKSFGQDRIQMDERNEFKEASKIQSAHFEYDIYKDLSDEQRDAAMRYKECFICYKRLANSGTLKRHIIRHYKSDYKCHVCGKTFATESYLRAHLMTHNRTTPYSCGICLKEVANLSSLRGHMKIHTGEKPYKCEICEKSFTEYSTRRNHMQIHDPDKKFKCEMCEKSFSRKSTLDAHLKRYYRQSSLLADGNVVQDCPVCFNTLTFFKQHMPNNHRMNLKCDFCGTRFNPCMSLDGFLSKNSDKKEYSCSVCLKTFSLSFYLTRHMRIHTGEKRFVCEVCQRAFTDSSTLRRHRMVHTTVKNIFCHICSKAFSKQASLQMHMRIHEGIKSHVCKVCSKAFHHGASLTRHMNLHIVKLI